MRNYIEDYYGREHAAELPPGTYRVEKCNRCGALFQAEIGDNALLAHIYGKWLDFVVDPEAEIDDYRFGVANPRLSRDGHEIMSAAAHLGLPLSRMVTLDFGMGWASWARIAQLLGCQSYGSELSVNRMAYAKSFGVRTITLEEADGLGAHFINTEQVFEHLADPRYVLAGLVRALAPDGIIKIAVPAPNKVEDALRESQITFPAIMPVHPLEHVTCFNEEALAAMGREFGLEIVRPSYAARYAFLGQGALSLRKPKNALKELVRPFYTYRSRRNLLVWLRRAEAASAALR